MSLRAVERMSEGEAGGQEVGQGFGGVGTGGVHAGARESVSIGLVWFGCDSGIYESMYLWINASMQPFYSTYICMSMTRKAGV